MTTFLLIDFGSWARILIMIIALSKCFNCKRRVQTTLNNKYIYIATIFNENSTFYATQASDAYLLAGLSMGVGCWLVVNPLGY